MKRIIKFILLIFIICLGLTGIAVVLGFTNYSDYSVASFLPRYKESSNWNVSHSSGFPDGLPGATIEFQYKNFNKQTNEKFIEDYGKELVKNGWHISNTKSYSFIEPNRIIYSKKIFLWDYEVSLYKYINSPDFLKKYGNNWINRELIFVNKNRDKNAPIFDKTFL